MMKSNFSYYNPGKLLSGNKALEAISFELQTFGCKKPLVLFPAEDRGSGRDKILVRSFCNSGVTVGFFNHDPYGDNYDDIYNTYVNRGCDSIISIGVRASNTAKLIKIAIDSGEMPSSIPDTYKFSGKKNMPLVVIPSGIPDTGIYSGNAYFKEKCITDRSLYPDVICIDPRMTVSKSSGQGVFHAFEAFAFAMESLMSSGNPFAASNTGIALKFINKYLPLYIKKPSDRDISFGLCNGVIFAAMGINNTPGGMMKYICLAYEKISGEKSVRFATLIFRSIFDYYLTEYKPDPAKLLLSLTDPDTAASVKAGSKLNIIREIAEKVISLVEKSLGDNPPEIIMFPDYLKAIESKSFMMSGQSISKKDFERVLTDAFT